MGPVSAALALGFWGLDRGSMWQDESVSFEVSQRTLGQILALLRRHDAVHGLYYLLLHGWMLPGGGEVWLRVPSVLAAGTAAGLVAALGLRLRGVRAGLFAGLLFAGLPVVSYYAQEGRSYALVGAVVLLATYALVRAVETPGRWRWPGYLAAMVFAVGLHEFALLVLPAHGLTLLLARVGRPAGRRWLVSAGLCGLVSAPLVWLSQRQAGQVSWLTRPGADAVVELSRWAIGGSVAAGLVFGIAGLAGLTVRAAGPARLGLASVAAPLALVPPVVLLAVSQLQPLYHPRYVFFSVAGIALLAGAGLDRLAAAFGTGRGRDRLGWTAGLVVIGLVFAAQLPAQRAARTPESRPNDLAGVARVVGARSLPGDGLLFMPSRYRAAALGYPGAFARVHDVSLARTPIEAANLRGTNKTLPQTRAAMLATDRLWVVGRPGLRLRPTEAAALDQQAVLRTEFVAVHRTRLHGMEVALYLRRPR